MGEACSMDSECNQHHSECLGVCSCVDGYEYDQFALECYPGQLFTYYPHTVHSDFHYETYIGISPYRTLAIK